MVVTNPPFSGDHLPKVLRFCSRRDSKPWFLLLPNYVYLKACPADRRRETWYFRNSPGFGVEATGSPRLF